MATEHPESQSGGLPGKQFGEFCGSESYRSQIRDIDHLKERLIDRFNQNIIDRAVNQWRDRQRICIRAKGEHFEHLI